MDDVNPMLRIIEFITNMESEDETLRFQLIRILMLGYEEFRSDLLDRTPL